MQSAIVLGAVLSSHHGRTTQAMNKVCANISSVCCVYRYEASHVGAVYKHVVHCKLERLCLCFADGGQVWPLGCNMTVKYNVP